MEELPSTVDVLVVGAGPAGLTASAVLAERGVSHLTVDRAPLGANTSRAAVVHARTLEVLEEIGVAETLVECGVIVPTFTLRDRDRTLAAITFDELPTRYPYTLMVPQNVTAGTRRAPDRARWPADRRLATGFARPGRQPRAGARRTGHDEGRRATVDARYVVGTDGMHSTVREQAGISFDGAA
jgi:2-polyprenyl-6-methoxyphenol hydroxylase-like FAD-dependent oxidoreductase